MGDMLQKGIIRESVSPWSSPVVLVKKKGGSCRFCVDLRKVNAVTRKDSFSMSLVSDIRDALSGTKYSSTLDLKSGYCQIETHQSLKKKQLSLHTTVFTNLMLCSLVLPIPAPAFSVLWVIYFED